MATSADHVTLTHVAFEAKRFWGYPEEWIEMWKSDLTVTPSYIVDHYVFKAMDSGGGTITGFCAIEWLREKAVLEVAHLWIRPMHMKTDLGTSLLTFALKTLESLPAIKILVVSDPNARNFYEKQGFAAVGEFPSVPEGRVLPVLEKAS